MAIELDISVGQYASCSQDAGIRDPFSYFVKRQKNQVDLSMTLRIDFGYLASGTDIILSSSNPDVFMATDSTIYEEMAVSATQEQLSEIEAPELKALIEINSGQVSKSEASANVPQVILYLIANTQTTSASIDLANPSPDPELELHIEQSSIGWMYMFVVPGQTGPPPVPERLTVQSWQPIGPAGDRYDIEVDPGAYFWESLQLTPDDPLIPEGQTLYPAGTQKTEVSFDESRFVWGAALDFKFPIVQRSETFLSDLKVDAYLSIEDCVQASGVYELALAKGEGLVFPKDYPSPQKNSTFIDLAVPDPLGTTEDVQVSVFNASMAIGDPLSIECSQDTIGVISLDAKTTLLLNSAQYTLLESELEKESRLEILADQETSVAARAYVGPLAYCELSSVQKSYVFAILVRRPEDYRFLDLEVNQSSGTEGDLENDKISLIAQLQQDTIGNYNDLDAMVHVEILIYQYRAIEGICAEGAIFGSTASQRAEVVADLKTDGALLLLTTQQDTESYPLLNTKDPVEILVLQKFMIEAAAAAPERVDIDVIQNTAMGAELRSTATLQASPSQETGIEAGITLWILLDFYGEQTSFVDILLNKTEPISLHSLQFEACNMEVEEDLKKIKCSISQRQSCEMRVSVSSFGFIYNPSIEVVFKT